MLIPELKIEDVCIVGDGAHASIKRVDAGVMYLSSKNFNKEGIVLDNIEYISEDDYQKHFRENSKALTKPLEDDLIFSIIGSIGGVYIYKDTDIFGLSSSVAILRPNKDLVDGIFLSYYLKSDYLQKWIEIIKSGSAQGFLSLGMIKRLPLKIPTDINIQGKIANTLSNYDNLIENNNTRIKLLENMAEELYKEWFVRLRFPNYQNTKIVDGIPDGWEKKKIGEFGKVIIGKTPLTAKEENYNGNVPFIKTPDFKQGMFVISTEDTLSELGANTQKNQFISKNSICVSCIGTVGEVTITTEKSQTNQQINSIELYDVKYLEYLYFCLKFSKTLIQAYASTGATMGNLSKGKFEQFNLINPNRILIHNFNKIIKPSFEQIKTLMLKNQNLKETRDLLLPRLISGKLDIKDLDIV